MNDAIEALTKRYANFSARARRGEYWFFVLFLMIGGLIVGSLEFYLRSPLTKDSVSYFTLLYQLIILIPTLSIIVRRLHDLDKSGWWLLISFIPLLGPLYLLVIFCMRGTAGDNSYGADPLATKDHPAAAK